MSRAPRLKSERMKVVEAKEKRPLEADGSDVQHSCQDKPCTLGGNSQGTGIGQLPVVRREAWLAGIGLFSVEGLAVQLVHLDEVGGRHLGLECKDCVGDEGVMTGRRIWTWSLESEGDEDILGGIWDKRHSLL